MKEGREGRRGEKKKRERVRRSNRWSFSKEKAITPVTLEKDTSKSSFIHQIRLKYTSTGGRSHLLCHFGAQHGAGL
jgi:hypothetical protein